MASLYLEPLQQKSKLKFCNAILTLSTTLVSNETTERLVPELVPDFVELERNEFHLRKVWNGTKRNDFFRRKIVTFLKRKSLQLSNSILII